MPGPIQRKPSLSPPQGPGAAPRATRPASVQDPGDAWVGTRDADGGLAAMGRRWACAGLAFEGPWSAAELAQLQGVLQRLTPAELARLRGVTLVRGGRDAELSGNYEGDYATARVVYFDSAFRKPRLPGSTARPDRDWVLFHELGHAVMYGADRNAGAQAKAQLARYEARVGEANAAARGPKVAEALAAVKGEARAYDEALARVDFASDQRRFEARMEGRAPVSTYGGTHIDEFFAEAFAMFKTQPEALAAFDPGIHDYFARGEHVVDWEALPAGQFAARPATPGAQACPDAP